MLAALARLWLQNRQGIPSRLVKKDELRELEPYVSDAVFAALYCPQDGVADHTATTRGLAEAARRLGAEVREGVTVSGMERRGERVTAVFTDQEERFPVEHTLFLLSNRHVAPLVQSELGVTLPIWWRLPQVIFTQPVDPVPMRHLIGHAHRTLAMKRGPAGSVMISWGLARSPESRDQPGGTPARPGGGQPGASRRRLPRVGGRARTTGCRRPPGNANG